MERVTLAGSPPPVHVPSVAGGPVSIAPSPESRLVVSPRPAPLTAPEIASPWPPSGRSLGVPPRILVTSGLGGSPIAVGDAPAELRMPPRAGSRVAAGSGDEPDDAGWPIDDLPPPELVFPPAVPSTAGATDASMPVPAAPAAPSAPAPSAPASSTPASRAHAPRVHAPKAPAPSSPPEASPYPRVELVGGELCFPLAARPIDWHSGTRYFGARRDHGKRRHAGCDLMGPKGTQIYAIADGTLVQPPYYFYTGTWALEVIHGPYIVRYGEILRGSYTGGKTVKKGEPICKIGRLDSGKSMLHFEMYSNSASRAPLTFHHHGIFQRRDDLMDPTKLLDEWAKQLSR